MTSQHTLCACKHHHPNLGRFCDDPTGNCKCGDFVAQSVQPARHVTFYPPVLGMGDAELYARVKLATSDAIFPALGESWYRNNIELIRSELDARAEGRVKQ